MRRTGAIPGAFKLLFRPTLDSDIMTSMKWSCASFLIIIAFNTAVVLAAPRDAQWKEVD